MKLKYILGLLTVAGSFLTTDAQTVLANFDDVAIGSKWTMWGPYGVGTSTATVEADPKNASNHVLHIKLKDWNTFPEFAVPVEFEGKNLAEKAATIRFRMYRSNSETDDYKQLHIYFGNDQIYADNSYPYQGDKGQWQNRTYNVANVPDNSDAKYLRLGIHHNNSDYYIDDVVLYGPYDDYQTIASGLIDICQKNTSSSYATYTSPILIPEGKKLDVRTSRYTDFAAPIAGKGTLNIYSGGERTFLGGHSDKKYPSWDAFTGDVNVYPYKSVESGAGFYGIIMVHNGKTFSPEDIEGGLKEGKVCCMLGNNKVTLNNGAAIAFEDGSRAARFGELNTSADSRIYGYYKAKAGAGSYLLVGNLDTDATLAGRIAPPESNGVPMATQLLGIIKEGKGTYSITANNNVIPAGVRVVGGRLNINNDAALAEKSKLTGGTGSPATSSAMAAYVFKGGVLGGTGNIAGNVDVYGTVEPGTDNVGTLTIKDFAKSNPASLRLHPTAVLRFKIKGGDDYDRLVVANNIERSDICEDFTTSSDMPRVKIVLAEGADIKVGDEFQILTAKSRTSASAWTFDIVYPSRYTWQSEERKLADGSYALVVRVASLLDDPANAGNDDDNPGVSDDEEDDTPDSFADDGDKHGLRYYADQSGFKIGVAVSSNIDVNNTSDSRVKAISDNFNMVVPENNLKFENVEPSQNSFSYGAGDALAAFTKRNGMVMRGHTLAWHSQVAQWVSTDGKKNDKGWTKPQLMDILKNHIMNVVKHYKGKIFEWDVVNECLDDDQSIVRSNPNGYQLRQQSIWTSVCGEAFIDSAFVWAHRADPDARLVLNDYDNEMMGEAKAQAFFNLAKRLKNAGIPIDGVGFQCHFDAGNVNHKALGNNIARFGELGLDCVISELDLGISGYSDAQMQQQARDYYNVVKTASSYPNCRSVLIWGLSDDMSWRSSNPLMWKVSMVAKPAYYAVRQMLNADMITDVKSVEQGSSAPIVSSEWFTVSGQKVDNPRGMTIRRDLHSDGTVSVKKILIQ